jgi:hypothetical protein
MKSILKKGVTVLVTLLLSSCATQNSKVACPSFDHHKHSRKIFKTGRNISSSFKLFSFKNTQKSNDSKKLVAWKTEKEQTNTERTNSKLIVSAQNVPLLLIKPTILHEKKSQKIGTGLYSISGIKFHKAKKIQINFLKSKNENSKKNTDPESIQKRERKQAILKGVALIVMAGLAFVFIPVLGTLPASIALVAIFLLDLLISFLIYKYYIKRKPKLAKVTSSLRLLYSALFAIGIGYHIAGSLLMFNTFWKLGLIGFGLHLIALGLLFNNEGGKKWVNIAIKSLLIAAGIGYMIINIGILFVPNPITFSASMLSIFLWPMILGELSFAVWMIIRGGKNRKQE